MSAKTDRVEHDSDPRTELGNGRRLRSLRRRTTGTYQATEDATEQAVLALAAEEEAVGFRGPFTERCARRGDSDYSLGLSKGTIARAEQGKPVFPLTLRILAQTYGVAYSDVVAQSSAEHAGASQFENLDELDTDELIALFRRLIELLERRAVGAAGFIEPAEHNGAGLGGGEIVQSGSRLEAADLDSRAANNTLGR